ncbi:MAG: hypothetical protein JST68_16725 [Bacteroidetes bacterium]|nr:hypothetical protein [Bacteroidota bacterium]
MRKIVVFLMVLGLGVAAVGLAACKKDKGVSANALMGSWRYTGSVVDSGNNRVGKFVDPAVGTNIGDTLRFAVPDTIYYTFLGSTTWSNFRTQGNQLILIGSAYSDTLAIRGVSGTQLQLGLPGWADRYEYRAIFEKFNP